MTLMTSWVESANSATTDFPLNNLPCGVFSTNRLEARCGVAIGDMILDMAALEEEGLITLAEAPVFDLPYWNEVMELGPEAWANLHARLIELLSAAAPDPATVAPHLVPTAEARLPMPVAIAEYTDFYAGPPPATNVGNPFLGAGSAAPPPPRFRPPVAGHGFADPAHRRPEAR